MASLKGGRQTTVVEPRSGISPIDLKWLRTAFIVLPAVLCMHDEVLVINLYEMHSQPYLHSILQIKFTVKKQL